MLRSKPGRFFGQLFLLLAAALVLAVGSTTVGGSQDDRSDDLQPASAFAGIADDDERAVALFREAGKVLQHPRCVNCHPAGDQPLQGEDGHVHEPPVLRGSANSGVAGMRCGACHHDENFEPGGDMASVPGAPHWHLAPRPMAWQGLTLGELCAQVKDPRRNGGKDLEEIVEHMAEDPLVAWGWDPGEGREPVPGTQEAFAALIRAWVDAGAACP